MCCFALVLSAALLGSAAYDEIRGLHADLVDIQANYEGVFHPGPDWPEAEESTFTARFAFHADGVFFREVYQEDEKNRLVRSQKSVRKGAETRVRSIFSYDRKDYQLSHGANVAYLMEQFSFGWFLAPAIFGHMEPEMVDSFHFVREEERHGRKLGVYECDGGRGEDRRYSHFRMWIDRERGGNLDRIEHSIDHMLLEVIEVDELALVKDAKGVEHWIPLDARYLSYTDLLASEKKHDWVPSPVPRQWWSVHVLLETCKINTGVAADTFEVRFNPRAPKTNWSDLKPDQINPDVPTGTSGEAFDASLANSSADRVFSKSSEWSWIWSGSILSAFVAGVALAAAGFLAARRSVPPRVQ